ncbi:MAG: hypothetical protein AUJ01_14620 [Acidobacteria bacterium 13_1_40CM_3_65_5]|nr:MAG: hypothetical protein AUJ01_14620 [Acidobacteria bacterium 13_1_40CM_3_65_5]
MMFVLRMAVRETRASWRRLLFFFVCIAVGVAAIVALRSVIQSVRDGVNTEAKALVGADVVIGTNREWPAEARQKIDSHLAEAGAFARTETTETPTMVRPADGSKPIAKMAELRAVQAAYPLYGAISLQNGQTYSHALLENHGALVRPELLTALHVKAGDRINVGLTTFTIRGVIAREPGGGPGGFSLGPRIYIDYADVPSTGLLGFGSRAQRLLFVRVPDDKVSTLMDALRRDLRQDFINPRSYRSREDQIGRDFARAEDYLSLVGLVIVILGGIAVSSVTRVFILQKIRSIAVLKCVGARNAQIIAVYILQVMILGLAGSLLGVAIARAAVGAIPLALASSSPSLLTEAHYGVTWSAAAQGIAIGVLVSLLFSVVPLLQVRFINWLGIAALVMVSFALVAVTAWQASSLRVGVVVCAGFAGLAVVLQLAGKGLVALVAPLANSKSFPLRHAVLHLSRPGNQTRVVLLAVGLGAFFIVGIRSLQASLLDEFSIQTSDDSPDMFLLDIQRGQADGVRVFLGDRSHGAGEFQLIPVLRARVVGVSGRETNLDGAEEVRQKGVSLGREFTLTYRDHLEANERVIDGAFWSSPSSEPEVSVERQIAERARLHVGDTMRFDILGRTISPRRVPARGARSSAADLRLAAQRSRRSGRARAIPARSRRTVPERHGDRFPRRPREDPRRDVEGDAGDQHRRRARALQRRLDPHRRRRDDEVPARLRGRGVQNARREHAHDRAHAAVRVRRAGIAGGRHRIGGGDRAHVGREQVCARNPVENLRHRARRRGRAHGLPGRRHRRRFQPRRPAAQAARDATSGMTPRGAVSTCRRRVLGVRPTR